MSLSRLRPHFKPIPTIPKPFCLSAFRDGYFHPGLPVHLPGHFTTYPAISSWFQRQSSPNSPKARTIPPSSPLHQHASLPVPLEVTIPKPGAHANSSFHQITAPLSLLLDYLSGTIADGAGQATTSTSPPPHLYLAQLSLDALPRPLQHDLPTPELVRAAGKGDVYATSLWLGRGASHTPLHRDPNPNLFLQLAGRKRVRLLRPEVGDAVWRVSRQGGGGSAAIRGEEMMKGSKMEGVEGWVWGNQAGTGVADVEGSAEGEVEGWEVEVESGDALFIPKGWWHSVRGVGDGVVGSANWWFR